MKGLAIFENRITISIMQAPQANRGGARPGSGRKPLGDGETMQPVSIKMNAAQKEKYQRLGGAPWVREKIDKAKEPTKKE